MRMRSRVFVAAGAVIACSLTAVTGVASASSSLSAGTAASAQTADGTPWPATPESTYPTPPPGTDFTTLSASQLAYYGLPPKPALSSVAYPDWNAAMKAARTHDLGGPALPPTSSGPPVWPPLPAGNIDDVNWSGWVTTDGNRNDVGGPYNAVAGNMSVPGIYQEDSQSRNALQWVGLNGVCQDSSCSAPNSTPLLQAGVAEYSKGNCESFYPWWEIYPDYPTVQPINEPISVGDNVFVQINAGPWQGQSYVFIEDTTRGWYYNVPASSTHDGCPCNTVEAVDENPFENGNQILYMVFHNPASFNGVYGATASGDAYLNNLPVTPWSIEDFKDNQIEASPTPFSGNNFSVQRFNND